MLISEGKCSRQRELQNNSPKVETHCLRIWKQDRVGAEERAEEAENGEEQRVVVVGGQIMEDGVKSWKTFR